MTLNLCCSTRQFVPFPQFILCAICIATALALPGCGKSDAKMADVSGTVTLKDKPLADAEVYFVSGSFQGYGRTDENGHYRLVRGAPIGECKVYIKKTDTEGDTGGFKIGGEGMDEEQYREWRKGQGLDAAKRKKPTLPPEYSDPEKTKLTFTVPPGGTKEADFNL
jgi:hypothetical protein